MQHSCEMQNLSELFSPSLAGELFIAFGLIDEQGEQGIVEPAGKSQIIQTVPGHCRQCFCAGTEIDH